MGSLINPFLSPKHILSERRDQLWPTNVVISLHLLSFRNITMTAILLPSKKLSCANWNYPFWDKKKEKMHFGSYFPTSTANWSLYDFKKDMRNLMKGISTLYMFCFSIASNVCRLWGILEILINPFLLLKHLLWEWCDQLVTSQWILLLILLIFFYISYVLILCFFSIPLWEKEKEKMHFGSYLPTSTTNWGL